MRDRQSRAEGNGNDPIENVQKGEGAFTGDAQHGDKPDISQNADLIRSFGDGDLIRSPQAVCHDLRASCESRDFYPGVSMGRVLEVLYLLVGFFF